MGKIMQKKGTGLCFWTTYTKYLPEIVCGMFAVMNAPNVSYIYRTLKQKIQ